MPVAQGKPPVWQVVGGQWTSQGDVWLDKRWLELVELNEAFFKEHDITHPSL